MREKQRFYQNPRTQNLIIIAVFLLLFIYMVFREGQLPTYRDVIRSIFYTITLQFNKIPTSMRLLAFDTVICMIGGFLWIAFFAQFVLPLRTLRDRYLATERLVLYLTAEHGPALFIENGKILERKGEINKKGPGVIILDGASSAVLRDDFTFKHPKGPGVVFTPKFDYLASSVDLHVKSSPDYSLDNPYTKAIERNEKDQKKAYLGPLGDEDPFKPIDTLNDEPQEVFNRRQARRLETSALTRDAVEAVPNIAVGYRLKYDRPWNPRNAYRYYPAAVLQWVIADGPVSTTNNPKWADVPLHNLPAYMAAEVWREYLQKFTLEELFTAPILELSQEKTAFSKVLEMVQARLTRPMVENLDSNGHPTGQKINSQEYLELRKRGIRVQGVAIYNLRFKESIENKLVDQWKATWLDRALKESNLVDRKRRYSTIEGIPDGLVKFVRAAIQQFPQDIDDVSKFPRPRSVIEELSQLRFALSTFIRGLRGEIRADTRLSTLLQTEDTDLSDMLTQVGEQES